jgi:23S rRNA (uracil1939-C5)-methyltransferase
MRSEDQRAFVELTIDKLVYGGEGLGHHQGDPIFVPFVLPGEQIEAALVERKKKFVRAALGRVLNASPERVAAPCPHFAVCGGCDYQHIPYQGQLQYKSEILRETLRRLGRLEWTAEIKTHASPPWNYRNRAQWKVRPMGDSEAVRTPGEAGTQPLAIGYFRANSTALCAIKECIIVSPLLQRTFLALQRALAGGAFPRQLREIEVFANASDTKLLFTATFSGFAPRATELMERFRSTVPEIESLLLFDPTRGRMELWGPGFIEYPTLDRKYRVGHFSFFQVNRFLVAELVQEVTEAPTGSGRDRQLLALDLFAGVGLFSLPLASQYERVVAVE